MKLLRKTAEKLTKNLNSKSIVKDCRQNEQVLPDLDVVEDVDVMDECVADADHRWKVDGAKSEQGGLQNWKRTFNAF